VGSPAPPNSPARRKDTVVVTLKRIPGELRLTASDDGKGIDRQRTDSVVGGGLVAMFARQLGGQVEREDRRPVEDVAWR
jgi:signal transduction histidine kinase